MTQLVIGGIIGGAQRDGSCLRIAQTGIGYAGIEIDLKAQRRKCMGYPAIHSGSSFGNRNLTVYYGTGGAGSGGAGAGADIGRILLNTCRLCGVAVVVVTTFFVVVNTVLTLEPFL